MLFAERLNGRLKVSAEDGAIHGVYFWSATTLNELKSDAPVKSINAGKTNGSIFIACDT